MDAIWSWTDLGKSRGGAGRVPYHIRFLLITAAFGAGMTFGELIRMIGA